MAVIETWFNQDLQKPVKVQYLDGSLFSNNGNGNRIGVNVYDNGEAVALTGSVSGYAVLSDGTTVPCTGARTGNKASILVPPAAYFPGALFLSIFITDGTTVTTLAAVSTSVLLARTDSQVDPGTVVTDWTQTINGAMQDVQTAAENLGQIVATPYPSLTYPVPLGKYTYYNGNLYRCVSPIASSENFTPAHWSAAINLGDEVSDLKSAIDANEDSFNRMINTYSFNNRSPVQLLWEHGSLSAGSNNVVKTGFDYRVVSPQIYILDRDISFKMKTGFRLYTNTYVNNQWIGSWRANGAIRSGNPTMLMIGRVTEDTSEVADIKEFVDALIFKTALSDLEEENKIAQETGSAGIVYEIGNTHIASGVPIPSNSRTVMISSLIPVNAGTKILLLSSQTYNVANVITAYDSDGAMLSRNVYSLDANSDNQEIEILSDGYIRRCYGLASASVMSDEIDAHIRSLFRIKKAEMATKKLNAIEKVYDYNSSELGNGFVMTAGNKVVSDRWRYVVHTCSQGDIFLYNGVLASGVSCAIFYDANNHIIGYVDPTQDKKIYRNEVIEIPFFCARVCFNWFTAEGYNPCSVYRFTDNNSLPVSIRQNDIIDLIGSCRYDGLKININGDSISTASAGKWSNFIQNQLNCTFKLVGTGGAMMTRDNGNILAINNPTRIANLDEDADIVMTDGGANDWSNNVTIGSLETLDDPTTFAGAVQLYIQRVMEQCPNARIICMGTNYTNHKNRFNVEPLIGEKNNNGNRITDFNDMYRKVCEYNSVEFINIYELCGINRYNYTTYLEQDTHDYGYGYIHPNNAGGKKYLDVILNYLFYGKNS